MGWRRTDLTPGIIQAMSKADQERYGPPGNVPKICGTSEDPEKKIQQGFIAACEEKGWRPVWHGMHKRSTANRGCPDFIVAARGHTFWIEFKKPGEELSPDQKLFSRQLGDNGVAMYTCFSWQEAVEEIEKACFPA